ncbi:hypothetical protein [Arthrobacter sp. M4]|uniref:hypothetical protein n=1 Tax=Arthrobacter sp. M4 TaxID=218160 RepID=UPI001CDBBE56|nr:hypothetical protein [Arthrobacter sp. M4]MCA4134773.1 hypothetical protein [Arthrobacter sp. M4]
MKGKLLFAAGVAAGYVWGTRTGREGYERLVAHARKIWGSETVQHNVHEATEFAKDKGPDLAEALADAAKKFSDLVSSILPGPTEPRASDSAPRRPDVVSDPAHSDEVGQDWTDEGGAAPEGPATNTRP